ncbi:MAG TPA: glycoside hydrolase family 43 protein [Phycisphaerae bacterium]|nr:glycoside hydrolase family 43 protein [Phycisphaerae bacterium]
MKRFLACALLPLTLALLAATPATPPAATAPATQGGYLFTTFKGEQTPMTEQIYFGLSADGLHWDALNKGDPVLVTDIGEKGARDPYLLRTHDNKFVILATDLNINLNKDWNRATHAGSKSLLIWQSDDLVKWSKPRLVKVAPDDAGCTWAPEAIYDEATKDYLIYWASTTKSDNFAKHRIWSVRTPDFQTFSKPEVYIEKPNTVIDTDIIRDGNRYYRFTKDEKLKAITMESADKVAGPWADVEGFSLATMQGYEGPAAFQLKPADGDQPATWCLLLDYYSKGQGYKPFTTTNIATGKFTPNNEITFPFRFRHGSVLALTSEELARVKAAYTK